MTNSDVALTLAECVVCGDKFTARNDDDGQLLIAAWRETHAHGTTADNRPPLPTPDVLGDKARELRQTLVAYIADGMGLRNDHLGGGHHVAAGDLLAQYLTTFCQWQEVEKRSWTCVNCRHDSPHTQQDGDECWCGCVDYRRQGPCDRTGS